MYTFGYAVEITHCSVLRRYHMAATFAIIN